MKDPTKVISLDQLRSGYNWNAPLVDFVLGYVHFEEGRDMRKRNLSQDRSAFRAFQHNHTADDGIRVQHLHTTPRREVKKIDLVVHASMMVRDAATADSDSGYDTNASQFACAWRR